MRIPPAFWNGSLEIGLNKEIRHLQEGDVVRIKPKEKHYYHNSAQQECRLKVVVNPGNKNFEYALQIYRGLAGDRLISKAGTPKKLADLALFVYLSNTKMVGLQKLAEPVLGFIAKLAIRNGRLDVLKRKYGQGY